jgi:hypothetical protein
MAEAEIILPLDYRESEVVPAQRARFRQGTRLKFGLYFGVLAAALFVAARLTEGGPSRGGPAALVPVLFLVACVAGVLLFTWRFAPVIDFRTNAIWKARHRIRLTPEALFLEPPDGGRGTELPWPSVRKVIETPAAFVLVYRSEREFLIVPRRILGAHEPAFRERLPR